MAELSSGTETQANSLADLSESMNDFAESVRISEQEGQEIATTSKNVLSLTTEGTALMKESVQSNEANRFDCFRSSKSGSRT